MATNRCAHEMNKHIDDTQEQLSY